MIYGTTDQRVCEKHLICLNEFTECGMEEAWLLRSSMHPLRRRTSCKLSLSSSSGAPSLGRSTAGRPVWFLDDGEKGGAGTCQLVYCFSFFHTWVSCQSLPSIVLTRGDMYT